MQQVDVFSTFGDVLTLVFQECYGKTTYCRRIINVWMNMLKRVLPQYENAIQYCFGDHMKRSFQKQLMNEVEPQIEELDSQIEIIIELYEKLKDIIEEEIGEYSSFQETGEDSSLEILYDTSAAEQSMDTSQIIHSTPIPADDSQYSDDSVTSSQISGSSPSLTEEEVLASTPKDVQPLPINQAISVQKQLNETVTTSPTLSPQNLLNRALDIQQPVDQAFSIQKQLNETFATATINSPQPVNRALGPQINLSRTSRIPRPLNRPFNMQQPLNRALAPQMMLNRRSRIPVPFRLQQPPNRVLGPQMRLSRASRIPRPLNIPQPPNRVLGPQLRLNTSSRIPRPLNRQFNIQQPQNRSLSPQIQLNRRSRIPRASFY